MEEEERAAMQEDVELGKMNEPAHNRISSGADDARLVNTGYGGNGATPTYPPPPH